MKSLFSTLIILCCIIHPAQAQNNTGIGTLTPKASAILDVSSTTKGLAIPTMTSTQRIQITSPANGLLVYDSTSNRIYQYQDGVWRYLITNEYWNHSTTRSIVYNSSDSVGVGTTLPSQKLDVNGNIRSRKDVLADEDIHADGTVSASAIISTGNAVVTGTSLLNGAVTTNSDININNTSATIQLKSSSTNKGFLQLSGDNVRTGTNSGNAGDYVIRMNGNDRVKIDQQGNLDLDGKITRNAVAGNMSLLPTAIGFISGNGTINKGTGNFTVTRVSAGIYYISGANFGTLTNPSVAFFSGYYRGNIVNGVLIETNKYLVAVRDADTDVSVDAPFYFMVYGE